tara:strand:+ start:26625 stop:27122 length:498 start_codon:yes stop_codon:yes gene_type:complete
MVSNNHRRTDACFSLRRTTLATVPLSESDFERPSSFVWRFLSATVVAAVATYATAHVWHPQRIMHLATWIVIGFVLLPIAFTLALAAVAAIVSVLLGLLCIPAAISGRPTGLGPLLRELWHLPRDILPDLWHRLRTTDRPGSFGAAAGVVAGISAFAWWQGLGTR